MGVVDIYVECNNETRWNYSLWREECRRRREDRVKMEPWGTLPLTEEERVAKEIRKNSQNSGNKTEDVFDKNLTSRPKKRKKERTLCKAETG